MVCAAKPKHSSALTEIIFYGRYDFHMHTVRHHSAQSFQLTRTHSAFDGWMDGWGDPALDVRMRRSIAGLCQTRFALYEFGPK